MITNYPKKVAAPHIGENGNWFLGKEDTGVAAQGGGNTSIIPVTLISSGWNTDNASQNISIDGILEDEIKQIITIVPFDSNMELYEDCDIECSAFGVDNLTFTAKTIPAEDISVYVILENVTGSKDTASNVYSTEETVVGTWIDGKPIYRKVFIIETSIPQMTTVDLFGISTLNIDDLVGATGLAQILAFPYFRVLPDEATVMGHTTDNAYFRFHNGYSYELYVKRIVIEYTKTTDTATIEIPSAMSLKNSYEQGVNES